MSVFGSQISKPALILVGLGYVLALSVALIVWHLPPEIILALTLGGFSLLILSVRPYVGVLAFTTILFVENAFGSGEGITPMKVIGVVILTGWLVNLALEKRKEFQFTGFVLVLLFFLVWCGISLAYAVDTRTALSLLFTYAQLALATLMFKSVVDTPDRMRGVYWTFVVCATLSTIVAIVGYYFGLTRAAMGLVGNKNLLATYISVAIVCAYFLHQETKDGVRRMALVACLPVLFLGLALTFSRAGLMVLVLTLGFVWYRVARQRKFLMLAGSISMLCLLTFVLPAAFWQRAGSIVPAIRRQEDTFGTRLRLWRVALRMVEDRPVVGVGPGNYVVAYPRYARGGDQLFQKYVTHNAYVGMAAETGVIGLGLFVLISGLALREARRAVLTGRAVARTDIEILGAAAEVSLLAMLMAGMSGNVEGLKCLWVFYGLAVATGGMARRLAFEGRRTAGESPPAVFAEGLGPWAVTWLRK